MIFTIYENFLFNSFKVCLYVFVIYICWNKDILLARMIEINREIKKIFLNILNFNNRNNNQRI